MKKPQWITIVIALLLTGGLYFARTIPPQKAIVEQHSPDDGHDHGTQQPSFSIDSLLSTERKKLTPSQIDYLNNLKESINGEHKKDQPIHVYHQLARFWADSVRNFSLYAWYEGEAARLENSEKSLTFAARLFLDNLQNDELLPRRQWKAFQAKDLFERSLSLNAKNDSAKVGLGAVYLFGNISDNPMEGIVRIREVVERDSNNIYAHMILAKGSLISGQYDKAISRLLTINRLETNNLEAIMLLADTYERSGKKEEAAVWYQKSLPFISQNEMKKAVENRIEELKK